MSEVRCQLRGGLTCEPSGQCPQAPFLRARASHTRESGESHLIQTGWGMEGSD